MPELVKRTAQQLYQGPQIMTFHQMLHQCLLKYSKNALKKEFEDVEDISRSGLTWENFQRILQGEYPSSIEELETIVGILDPQGEVSQEWEKVWEWERQLIQSDHHTDEKLIRNGNNP